MKVALFKHQITGLGGTERVIVEYMRRSKHETVLFTDKINESISQWPLSKHRIIEIAPSESTQLLERLHPLIIKLPLDNVDIITSFIGEALSEGIIIRNNSTPSIGYLAGIFRFVDWLEQKFRLREGKLTPLAKIYGVLSSKILGYYDKLVTNSNFVKHKLCKWVKLKRSDNILVIHPGVDTNIFKPVNVYENYFLTVCRIERLKRLELTIGAFNIFRKLYRQKFRLVVAGYLDPQNKSYLNHLTHICPKDVEFVINPRDEDLLELYQKAYAFVFSSLKEPFGLTPLEAMSCGKPIIATGQGGFVDYLIHGQNGFIVSSNPYAIAKKMLTLAENYELTFSLGEGARKTALSYDWEIFTKRMDNLVEQIVNK